MDNKKEGRESWADKVGEERRKGIGEGKCRRRRIKAGIGEGR